MRVVDSHLHLWDPNLFDYTWLEGDLARAFLQEDIDVGSSGVTKAIFVEAGCAAVQGLDEVRWVSAIAGGLPTIAGIVAHARIELGDQVRAEIDGLGEFPLVCGIRGPLQNARTDRIGSGAIIDGLREVASAGLVFDAHIGWQQLPSVAFIAAKVPNLRIVLDHLGNPPVTAGINSASGARWRADLRKVAAMENVVAKISGLTQNATSRRDLHETVRPFVEVALETFGCERCMIGSDWPISTIAPPYADWFGFVLDDLGLLPSEKESVANGTASEVYALP